MSARFQWIRIRSHGRWVSSPTVLTLHISLSAQSSSHFLYVSLPTFMLYGMRHSLKHVHCVMLPKSVCALLTINLFCLFSCYFIFLLMSFRKFLKPNRCTTIKTESCVCESLSVPTQSWTSLYCISECTWRAGAWTAQLTDDCHRWDTSQAVQSRKLWSYNAENTEFQDLCPLENASN
jgi:hypothetical protein